MAKDWAKPFYKGKAWKRCRAGYIDHRRAIDGGLCEICQDKLGYIVHHKIILTPENIHDPEVALNWENLSYECKDCHDQHEGHGVYHGDSPVCVFDSEGNPIGIQPEYEHNRL